MAKRGKTYNKALENIDKLKLYEAEEAMKLAVDTVRAKFDEMIEVHVRLGVDGRHADQQVRSARPSGHPCAPLPSGPPGRPGPTENPTSRSTGPE